MLRVLPFLLPVKADLAKRSETYDPFTRNYPQPSWSALPPSERAKFCARQGHTFATSFPLRVVYPPKSPGDKLVDVPRDGKTLGEVIVRGNIVMQGYFQDPDATARAFDGGYFHSGDIAVWHSDESIQIQDRIKDIIISGGEVCTVHDCRCSSPQSLTVPE
jgi:acyl-CoA synthetase (AMP-forming)/AMP-acid ligase II